ncbi:TonB-dependent receptor [Adhaeribacter terreus]|uniref:TonB-dependent receptor n=1 Tax=Adhaeribacter terreus TaxID=529703 RepID=A0ABW0EAM5_9BACT
MKVRCLLSLIFLLISFSTFAQSPLSTLAGVVKDENGQPVAYVPVALEGSVLGTTTDTEGNFELKQIKSGRYFLRVGGIGYSPVRMEINLGAGEERSLELTLKENGRALDEVVVSAGRTPEALDETPASVHVIDQQTLRNQIKINPNIAAVLATSVPGLALNSNTTSNVGQTLRGRNVLVMVDGIPQSTPLRAGSRDIRSIDPEAIERVEVVKGATAIYGNGADGGLINYITKKPDATKPFSAYTSIANTGMLVHRNNTMGGRITQQFSGKIKQFDYLTSGTYEQTGVYKDAEGKVLSPVYGLGETQMYNGFFKGGYNITSNHRVEGMYNFFGSQQASHYVEKIGKYNQFPTIGVLGERKGAPEGTKYNHNAQLKYIASNLIGNTSLEASVYTQRFSTIYGWTFSPTSFAGGGQSTIKSDKNGARFNFNSPLMFGNHVEGNVIYGADYLNDVTSQPLVDGRTWVPEMDLKNIAPYAQLQLNVYEDFIFKAGYRFDNVKVDVPSFTQVKNENGSGGKFINGGTIKFDASTFNVGLRYAGLEYFKPFVSYSQGFSIIDIGRYVRGATEDYVAKMDIKPVVVNNYEAGFHSKLGIVSFSGAYFISTSQLGANLVANAENTAYQIQRAPEHVEGFEAVADVFLSKKFQIGASIAKSEGKADLNNNNNFEDEKDVYLTGTRIAPLKITAYVTAKPTEKLFLNLQWLYSGARDRFEPIVSTDPKKNGTYGIGEGPVQAFDIFNLSAAYQVTEKLSLNLGVENMLNKKYYLPIAYAYGRDADYIRANGARYQLGASFKW